MDDPAAKPHTPRTLADLLSEWRRSGSGPPPREIRHLAEAIATLPPIDARTFRDLQESLRWSPGRLPHICNMFAGSAEELARALESRTLEPSALSRKLHALLGSAGMIGALQVETLVRQLKATHDADPQVDLTGASELLRAVARHFAQALEAGSRPEMRAHSAGGPGPGSRN